MEPRLSRYIWKYTWPQQLWILAIVLISMVPYFMSFDLPKQIVNGPIQGDGFAQPGATQVFLRIALPLPVLGEVEVFPGIPLERMPMLFALSGVFLALVIVNGLFKLYINTYKGRLGERFLRRVRYDLVDRILRFPPESFKRMKGAEVAGMVKDEVEPLGGFTGDAFVLPAMLGGQALTALVFIFVQSFWLGVITAIIVGVQAIIIPRMRRRLLVLGRERQLTARELAGRVSEIVDGIGTIHAYDTSNLERADVASRLGRIFKIRYDLYQWKFLVKFINNFLASVTPFLFYSVGGYLALRGSLDIGQLVAVIAAYKDLPGPLKELIDWDQARQEVQVKYQTVVSQFATETIAPAELQAVTPEVPAGAFRHPIAIANLGIDDDSGATRLEKVSLQIAPGDRIAIVNEAAGGGDALAEALARLVTPHRGRVLAGDTDLFQLPEAVTGRAITYVAPEPFLFFGSLRDNLLYGLKHAPLIPPPHSPEADRHRRWEEHEARSAGNPVLSIDADWIDYASAGVDGPAALNSAIRAALDAVLLGDEIVELAKRATVDPEQRPKLAHALVAMRTDVRAVLADRNLRDVIAVFDPDAYNVEATVGENLLFGNPTGPQLQFDRIAANPHFRRIASEVGLGRAAFDMGVQIAEQAVELFAGLPPDHPFFEQLTFMRPEDLPRYEKLLQALQGRTFDGATGEEVTDMIRLTFGYNELRHRFGVLTPETEALIVEARKRFLSDMPDDLVGAIEPYDPDRYIASASVLDNVLFGRISHRYANEIGVVHEIVNDLLRSLGLFDEIFEVGLEFHVGASGKRLTMLQRQKLGLARAILRHSDYYVLNRPLAGVDAPTQLRIAENVLGVIGRNGQAGRNPAVLWVVSSNELAGLFDRVLVFRKGALAEERRNEAKVAPQAVGHDMVAE